MRRSWFSCSARSTSAVNCASPKLRQNSNSRFGATFVSAGAQAKRSGIVGADCGRSAADALPATKPANRAALIARCKVDLSMDHLREFLFRVRYERSPGELAQRYVEHRCEQQAEQRHAE